MTPFSLSNSCPILSDSELKPNFSKVTFVEIGPEHDGQRLDNFLIRHLKGVPKSRIYNLLRKGEVRINKGRVKPDTRVKDGDMLRIAPIRTAQKGAVPEPGQQLKRYLAENVLFDKEGNVLEIKKNIQKPDSKIGEFTGIIKLSKKGSDILLKKFNELKKSHNGRFHSASSLKQSIIPDMIQELIDSGVNVEPIFISEKWCEIDTPQDLEIARKLFS